VPRELPVPTETSSRRSAWVEVNPAFDNAFAARGISTPAAFLDLSGEVVGGHPDRHVLRVGLPGFPTAFYLKRQHIVTRRERFRNWRAGFGWVSRSARESIILQQLADAGQPAPRWVAAGEDGRGRAFLLVEELADAVDLREVLLDSGLSTRGRARLADRIGQMIGLLHASGFTTPELTAKHLLVSRANGAVTPIDWQGAVQRPSLTTLDRIRALAALHASVADDLATPRERLRVLRAALRSARSAGLLDERFSTLARRIAREAAQRVQCRSIRNQRCTFLGNQRLIWLAGEAVCAVPRVAAIWPTPAITVPFYGGEPGALAIQLSDGRAGHLIRGRSFAPFGRLRAWARGKPWRSPGVTLGRLLFHLERYDIPAPRLLAFGQRLAGPNSAEWFALHTPPAPVIGELHHASAEQLGACLRQLHDAGCRPYGDPLTVFGMSRGVCVRDVTAIRLVKHLSPHDRSADLRRLLNCLEPNLRPAAEAGYAAIAERETPVRNRPRPVGVS
jgi:hypothetical protein